jgi:hypothetical protein
MSSPIEGMSRSSGVPAVAEESNKPLILGKIDNEIGSKTELPMPLRQQRDILHHARMHGGAFPSSEVRINRPLVTSQSTLLAKSHGRLPSFGTEERHA